MAQELEEQEEVVMVRDLSTYQLRVVLRQHAIILLIAVMVSLVPLILPGTNWAWWILKAILFVPAFFVATVRLFMLNGVKQELQRRERGGREVEPVTEETEADNDNGNNER